MRFIARKTGAEKKELITIATMGSLCIFLIIILFFSPKSFAYAQGNDPSLNARIMEAKELYKLGKKSEAIKVLEKAKANSPSSPILLVSLGELYNDVQKYDKAAESYKSALKLDTQSAGLHWKLANVYMDHAGKLEAGGDTSGEAVKLRQEASQTLEAIFDLEFKKDDVGRKKDVCALLEQNYEFLKEYDNALTVIEKWKNLVKGDPQAYYQAGLVHLTRKNFKLAKEQLQYVQQSSRSSPDLKDKAGEQLGIVEKEEKKKNMIYVRIGGACFVVLVIIVIVTLLAVSKSRPRASNFAASSLAKEDSLDDLNSFEGICKMALRKLLHLTQMPKGVIFLVNDEENILVPKVTFGIDKEVESLEYSALDGREWIVERHGQPFIFKLERREVSYSRAFPDAGDILSELEVRIGAPFVTSNRLIGIGYFGCPESKDKKKFRKLYEQHHPLIAKVAEEIAEALDELISRKEAITDPVTGLYNDAYFNERFPLMIDEARNRSKTCSLIMVIIDGYKDLMETFGEDYGEKLIKMSSIAINTAIGGTDSILCRLKDTRFVIVFPEATMDRASELTEKLKEEISSVKIARHIPPATASIGLGTFPATAIYAEKLLELVTDAVEKAQSEGGNRIQVAEKKLRAMETTRMTRDQVLAAVERRRQARKTMGLEGLSPLSESQGEENFPEEPAAGVEPAYGSEEDETPRKISSVTPWLAGSSSGPSSRSDPITSLPIDLKEKKDEIQADSPRPPSRAPLKAAPPPEELLQDAVQLQEQPTPIQQEDHLQPRPRKMSQVDEGAEGQVKGRKLLSLSPKGEGLSRDPIKPVSPFSRRSAPPPPSQDEFAPSQQDVRFDNGQMASSGEKEEQFQEIPAPKARTGGPSGPLDFSKEMQAIDNREEEIRSQTSALREPIGVAQGNVISPSVSHQSAAKPPQITLKPIKAQAPLSSTKSAQKDELVSGNITSDPLTGFYHRSSFEKALLLEAQKLRQKPGECTLLYFGLDNFEQLKQKYGSPKVRKVLKDMSDKLKAHIDEGKGIAGRIEENGFALFLPDTALPAGSDLATRMRVTVYNLNFYEFGQSVTISLGVSSYPQVVKNFREIVINSRQAMERAMKGGGNKVEIGALVT